MARRLSDAEKERRATWAAMVRLANARGDVQAAVDLLDVECPGAPAILRTEGAQAVDALRSMHDRLADRYGALCLTVRAEDAARPLGGAGTA